MIDDAHTHFEEEDMGVETTEACSSHANMLVKIDSSHCLLQSARFRGIAGERVSREKKSEILYSKESRRRSKVV